MADGAPDDPPPLEMPSLSLRRRRKPAAGRGAPRTTEPGTAEVAPPHRSHPDSERRRLPSIALSGVPAAALTGVAVGGLAVLLSWLAGVSCEALRGTSACGGGPGLLVLVVVLAVLAWSGSILLRLLGVPHPGSSSVLAVGILAVLVLVFLLRALDEWWALVAVPLASASAYAASWWFTTTVGEEQPHDTHASYDVR